MISRTAFTQLGYSPLLLAGTVLGMFAIYLLPPVLALGFGAWPAALAWLLMMAAYAPILRFYRRSLARAPAIWEICPTLRVRSALSTARP